MTFMVSSLAQAKPGRLEDAVALTRQGVKLLERHGAGNIRLFRCVSGELFGSLALSMEYPSMAAWGQAYEELMVDEEMRGYLGAAADGPLTIVSMANGTEIPLGDGLATGQGSVIQVGVGRPVPGRFEDAIDQGARFARIWQRLGATGTRLWQLGASGSQSLSLALVTEFAGMAALGAATDQFAADAEAPQIIGQFNGANPVAVSTVDLFTLIPL